MDVPESTPLGERDGRAGGDAGGPRYRRASGIRWLDRFGTVVLQLLEELGRFFYIMSQAVLWTPRRPFDPRQWFRQMVRVGWDSIPVVFLT